MLSCAVPADRIKAGAAVQILLEREAPAHSQQQAYIFAPPNNDRGPEVVCINR
jgi:hypothetical protein